MKKQSNKNATIFLLNGGEMGALIRSFDWSKTPLGPLEKWSDSHKSIVSMMLANRFPLLLWWGKDFIQIYNDAYIPIPGLKHPKALGQPAKECWTEIWEVIGTLIETPFRGGPATWMDDILLEVNRKGFFEETHFTIAYSPVPDPEATNGIGGVLATVNEITAQIIGERRIALLRDLAAKSFEARTQKEACVIAADTLTFYSKDIPFAIFYLLSDDKKELLLAAVSNLKEDELISPVQVNIQQLRQNDGWNFSSVLETGKTHLQENIQSLFREVPQGPWSDAPNSSVLIPIQGKKQNDMAGILICGISSRIKFDDKYTDFFELLSSQVSNAINTANAIEEERKRAERLEEIDKAKTVFFSNISHEFRTPLTLILGSIEEALKDPQTIPANQDRLEISHRNAMRLHKLVNNLLDFSRIESNQQKANFVQTDIAAFTENLASNFRSIIENGGLQFKILIEDGIKNVLIDKQMWEKVVFNLLSNAFKFTLHGTITINLYTKKKKLVLEVKDTGVGIPEKELPFMFERFHRVEHTQGRTYEGTGIGLSLIKELIKLHDGTISVKSKFGHGSIFTVSIPIVKGHLATEHLSEFDQNIDETFADQFLNEINSIINQSDNDPVLTFQTSNQAPTILVVDDNADMRRHLQFLLRKDFNVVMASNGKEAFELATKVQPSLILSDIMMPEVNGIELTKLIKQNKGTTHIPVVLLTARAGEESRIEGFETGADDYLVKPFASKELIARIKSQLTIANKRSQVEENLKRFLMQAPAAIALFHGPELIYTLANMLYQKLFGRTEEELIGHSVKEVFPEAADQGIYEIFELVYSSKETYTGHEFKATLKDKGQDKQGYYDFVIHPIKDEVGNVTDLMVHVVETTASVIARKKMEESKTQLEEREMQLNTMANAMPQLVWIADANGEVSYYNNRINDYKVGGKNTNNVWNWEDIIHPDDLEKTVDTWNKAFSNHAVYEQEHRLKMTDNSYKWHLSRAYPQVNEDGNVIKWYGTATDINAQKEFAVTLENTVKDRTLELNNQNLLLHQQNDLIKKVFDSTFDFIVVYDTEMRVVSINKPALSFLKKEEKDVVGKKILEISPGFEKTKMYKDLQKAINGKTLHNEVYQSEITGTFYENFLIPLLTPKDEVYAVLMVAHDNSTFVRSAEKLKEKNEELDFTRLFLQQIIDSSVELISVVDKHLNYITVNKKFEISLGLSRDQIAHKNLFEVTPAVKNTEKHFSILKALRGEIVHLDKRPSVNIPHDFIDSYFMPLIIKNKIEGVIIMSRNVTDIVHSEILLEHKNEELERINKELESFNYIASHDLQEPLRKIQTFIMLLEKDLDNAELRKRYFEKISSSSKRMSQLIQSVLDYSRLSQGTDAFQETDLNQILEKVKFDFELMMEEKHAEIISDILPVIRAVPIQMQQLFTNIISNSLKFSIDSPVIIINTRIVNGNEMYFADRIEMGRQYVEIKFTDNGIGFEGEYSEQIFQLFQRLHAQTEYTGTGVGLSIVSKIIENHKGFILAESINNQGAVFTIWLPY
ncbi:hypothetical protein C3K47_06045 [Solitalea longa]|uniref:histidine kinase n=1 Tax=Solitalea longa TaxID=2079460 RepID=A0A2S5A456_9SPHI|nr:ATP-binding protein [Solitalea longa]POY37325.1 hypothetical protein C3K47_06045 [Solitalea longa]